MAVAVLLAVSVPLVVIAAAGGGSDEDAVASGLRVEPSPQGAPGVVIYLENRDVNELETNHGNRSVTVECTDMGGTVVFRSRERWPFSDTDGGVFDRDEGIRADTSAERLAALPPAFTEAGTITAGNASQLSDAAAAGLVTGLQTARETGLEPLAEIVGRAVVAGPDSTLHLRPAEASEKLLAAQRLTAADIDLWEIN